MLFRFLPWLNPRIVTHMTFTPANALPANTFSVDLRTGSGPSGIELSDEQRTANLNRKPISVWTLLKTAQSHPHNGHIEPDQSLLTTEPAPLATEPASLTATPPSGQEVQLDRRAVPLQALQAQHRKLRALKTIAVDHPNIHRMMGALWGRPECSDYIHGLIMSGRDGVRSDKPRLTLASLEALLDLDRLHDIHLGELRDAAGLGRRPFGSH